ncbi:uncharacterized protein Bfra_011109 [Botrytis fragariae]|uniref:Uncharacterized protein n=1 Tax=Botrytis fragariae TaxID=1964551 RepID=A0A8H6AKJ0_9HELO|nr:uncharacterized protein Bfra_011109 [Botrytis fragariae]KAF5869302.1 hypothetical protein Bfra_011109 [Botrytis fragariae]
MRTPYYSRERRPRFFRVDVYFGKEGTGGYEYSWSARWWTFTAISYGSFVERCNLSLMENHPNTVLRDFRLILNVMSETYDKITPTNIQAVMRELQSTRGRRIVFPIYIKRQPSVTRVPD